MSDARKAIDADVAAFLARGGEISRPDPRRLQAVARKGYGRRFWVEQPSTMSAIDSRSDKTPPRTE